MKITFYGATKEVTGSCMMLSVGDKNILIDCGLHQDNKRRYNEQLAFDAAKIDAVIITHAHIDHSGKLSLLVKNGFSGCIFATQKTCELMSIMLMDSAHIQQSDTARENRKNKRSSKKKVEPLYTAEDVSKTILLFSPLPYGEIFDLCGEVKFRFTDAGHLLGSASVEVWLEEQGEKRKIVFSGDIGNTQQPIIKNPQYISEADFVVMESTYGNRHHEPAKNYTYDIARIIDNTFAKGGNVIFPAFAVGRTQELLYIMRIIKEEGLVKSRKDFSVYLDSPLAAEATTIYDNDLYGYADESTCEILKNGYNPIIFNGLRICLTEEESKLLNNNPEPKVIISASGMCDAGRIRHHLKHNLWRPECSIVFLGFQAENTLGRLLIDGIPRVKLFGEEIAVMAMIYNLKGLSAHADQGGLLQWIGSFENKPEHIFIVHGEEKAAEYFADALNKMGYCAHAPNFQEIYDIINKDILASGITRDQMAFARGSETYARLQAAGNRLNEVIAQNRYCPNKNIEKFINQIYELAKKWEL